MTALEVLVVFYPPLESSPESSGIGTILKQLMIESAVLLIE